MTRATRAFASRRLKRNVVSAQARCDLKNAVANCRTHGARKSKQVAVFAKENFEQLFVGSKNLQIEPESCLPFVNVRSLSRSGVERLVGTFDGRVGIPGHSKGHSSAGGAPIVLELEEEMQYVVLEYLKERHGMTDEEAYTRFNEKERWYGIVDGAHRHEALVTLISSRPESYKGYKWWVKKIEKAPIRVLKAFGRSRNELQRKEHIVDFTIYDVLRNLREEAVNMATEQGAVLQDRRSLPHGFIVDVADSYCGGKNFATETMRQLAGIAAKLSNTVIETIGHILNEECPEEARRFTRQKSRGSSVKYIDNRVFKKTITTATLRGATKFQNAVNEEDQINALYRLKYLSKEHNYKGFPRHVLDDQFERAVSARAEAEKFENMMESTIFRNNLLRTAKLDAEVERNEDNDRDLLPTAVDLFKDLLGDSALHQIQSWMRGLHGKGNTDEVSSAVRYEGKGIEGQDDDSIRGTNDRDEGREGEGNDDPQKQGRSESPLLGQTETLGADELASRNEDSSVLSITDTDLLHKFGIEAFQMKFTSFDVNNFDQEAQNSFDLVFGDPEMTGCFPGDARMGKVVIDDRSMEEFAQFACRVLVPGGYLLLFAAAEYYHRWERALSGRGFEVMPSPFVIVRHNNSVQETTCKKWPQSVSDLIVVSRVPGENPSGFIVDLESPYLHVPDNAHKRKHAAITNVPAPSSRLTKPKRRIQLRPQERAPQVVSEIITTFCRPGGRVLDPFAGVFTVVISCLATGRSSVLLETDTECYELAKKWLQMLAKTYLSTAKETQEERIRKRKRGMTAPQEMESLRALVRQMEDDEMVKKTGELAKETDLMSPNDDTERSASDSA